MAHYLGKLDFNKLIGVKIADVDMYGRKVKCLVVPMDDNGIQNWNGEIQLWFRAFAYREKRGKFSHFLMRYIPMKDIKKLSAKQIETFANNSIGAMMKTGAKEENENETLNF
jgi:hypothetical protein